MRLPCAIVVPNGLSVLARSTSTWIHWWSPGDLGELVDVLLGDLAPSLGPIVWPDELLELVDSVHGGGGAHAAEASQPRWYQGFDGSADAQRPFPSSITGRPWVTSDAVEVELEQRLERRVEALPVEALDLVVDLVRSPTPSAVPSASDHGVAEDQGVMARDVERHLVAPRLADRVARSPPPGSAAPGLDLVKPLFDLRRFAAALWPWMVASYTLAQLLGAAHVVRDR